MLALYEEDATFVGADGARASGRPAIRERLEGLLAMKPTPHGAPDRWRMTKEINLLGALHPASRAVELGLWNRAVAPDRLPQEVDALVEVLLSKNQQALRQLKFIIGKGVEADLHTAQGFEALSAGLTGAVNGAWQITDADQASGVTSFIGGGEQWKSRRALARDFWAENASTARS